MRALLLWNLDPSAWKQIKNPNKLKAMLRMKIGGGINDILDGCDRLNLFSSASQDRALRKGGKEESFRVGSWA